MRPIRSMQVLAAVAVVGTMTLAGCGTSTSTSSQPAASASSNGVAALTTDQILSKTQASAAAQSSVHVAGKGTSGGQAFGLDMKLTKAGGSAGSVTVGTDTLQIVVTGPDVYVKADDAFWTKNANAAVAAKISGKWVKTSTSNPTIGSLGSFGDFAKTVPELLKPDGTMTKGDEGQVGGQPAIALLDSKNGKLWVATTGDPLPLRIDGSTAGEGVAFTEWNASFDIAAPAAADTIDLDSLKS